jgi:VCBS repeat protein
MAFSWAREGVPVAALALCIACAGSGETGAGGGAGHGGGSGGTGGSTAQVGGGFTGGAGGAPLCKVADDDSEDAPTCNDQAPADSFAPEVQWTWTGPPPGPVAVYRGSFTTPLVGNFTDDNDDGAVDLCDVPDIVVTSIDYWYLCQFNVCTAHMFALSGDTGEEKIAFEGLVDAMVYPAFGDLDGDGVPEVVTTSDQGRLIAYGNDGKVKWTGDAAAYRASYSSACNAVSIYDLDADGSPEILFGWEVFDAHGTLLWSGGGGGDSTYWCGNTPIAADLDGDGMLEVLMGAQAYRHDGSLYWWQNNLSPAKPQVANLDDDPEPEVFLTSQEGITIVEHDGSLVLGPVRPTDPNPSPNCWGKPAVVHDFDGDGRADLGVGSCSDFTVYSVSGSQLTPLWSNAVEDISGLATGTAFDFLGDGVAEAIYADESTIYVFDGKTGAVSLTAGRTSGTLIEYPVVADVDNDGSAEIVFVSNYYGEQPRGPTVTVLRDAQDRWIRARRVWNQHAYHVTNVREDGTIPAHMKKSWQLLNTFRTNSQILENGADCDPGVPK